MSDDMDCLEIIDVDDDDIDLMYTEADIRMAFMAGWNAMLGHAESWHDRGGPSGFDGYHVRQADYEDFKKERGLP